MIVKTPPVYDISHYKEVLDFAKVDPRPVLFITKATEHTSYKDEKFVRFFAGMAQIGVVRGCYHFFRKAYSPTAQSQFFCDTIRPYITDKDILILDAEEEGLKASQLWAWIYDVRSQFPNNIVMLYSRKNLLDPIVMTNAEKEFFRNVPVWTAGYPTFPDLYSKVPSGYIPDQTKFGPVWLWQYSDKGAINGIQGSVDLNWIDPVFYAMIEWTGGTTPPPVDPSPTGGTVTTIYNLQATGDPTKIFSDSTFSKDIGKYSKGTTFKADSANAGGYHTSLGWVKKTQVKLLSTETDPVTPPPVDPPPNNPPPAGAPAHIDMTLAAGSVVTVKDSAGNVLWTGTA